MVLSEIFCNLGCLTIAFSKVAWLAELGSLLVGCGMGFFIMWCLFVKIEQVSEEVQVKEKKNVQMGYSSAAESGIMEELDLTLAAIGDEEGESRLFPTWAEKNGRLWVKLRSPSFSKAPYLVFQRMANLSWKLHTEHTHKKGLVCLYVEERGDL